MKIKLTIKREEKYPCFWEVRRPDGILIEKGQYLNDITEKLHRSGDYELNIIRDAEGRI